jgi:glycerophosphoryl diester phosphodiesterase
MPCLDGTEGGHGSEVVKASGPKSAKSSPARNIRDAGGAAGIHIASLGCDRMWATRWAGAFPELHAPATSVINIAHRGASAYAPEHTSAAYDLALELGADYIEPDVHMTADGELAAIHDATLDRTAKINGARVTGPISSLTMAELRMCDVGSWFNDAFPSFARPEFEGLQIQSLDDLFARYGRLARYYVELKTPHSAGSEEKLVRLIEKYDLMEPFADRWQVVIQSFSSSSLRKTRLLAPSLPLIQLFHVQSSRSIQARLDDVATYAAGIGPWKNAIDHELVDACHKRRLQVHAYTVDDDPGQMSRLLSVRIDGMFTDYPDRLDDFLNRRRRRGAHVEAAADQRLTCADARANQP